MCKLGAIAVFGLLTTLLLHAAPVFANEQQYAECIADANAMQTHLKYELKMSNVPPIIGAVRSVAIEQSYRNNRLDCRRKFGN